MQELAGSAFEIKHLLVTPAYRAHFEKYFPTQAILEATPAQLSSLGQLQQNDSALAVVQMYPNHFISPAKGQWTIALDQVRDPGNLGTILRIADWYGMQQVVCALTCANVYNPKTIQASMGSFTRVKAYYTDLGPWLSQQPQPAYAATLEGQPVHRWQAPASGGILLLGNESHGVQPELLPHCHGQLTIPRFGQAESLNVAIATAILCDNIFRQL